MTLVHKYRYQRLPAFRRHLIEESFLKIRVLRFRRTKWGFIKSKVVSIIQQKRRLEKKVRSFKFRQKKVHRKKKSLVHSNKVLLKNKKVLRFSFKSNNKLKLTKRQRILYTYSTYVSLSSSKGGYWERVKKAYKEGLFLSNYFKERYGSSFQNKDFRKQLKFRPKVAYSLLLRPLYKPDILLWKLNFFQSVKLAQHYIKAKKIFINDQPIKKSFLLKGGDVIKVKDLKRTNYLCVRFRNKSRQLYKSDLFTLKRKSIALKRVKRLKIALKKKIRSLQKGEKDFKKYRGEHKHLRKLYKKFARLDIRRVFNKKKYIRFKSRFFHKNFLAPFCEYDPYTGTVVILKDVISFSPQDLSLIFRKKLDVSLFKYFLRKN